MEEIAYKLHKSMGSVTMVVYYTAAGQGGRVGAEYMAPRIFAGSVKIVIEWGFNAGGRGGLPVTKGFGG